jgi:integrase
MPTPKSKPKAITPAFLRHVKLPASSQVEITDGGCPGLRLRLSTSSASWVLGCRDAAGKARRFHLGGFPAMGLREAREAARKLRVEVRGGRDPIAEAQARRLAARQDNTGEPATTLLAIIDAYEKLVGGQRRSWPWSRRMIGHVFRAQLARPALELTAPELQLVIDAHGSRASAGAAVRALKPVLKWAAKRGLIAGDMAAALEQPEGAQGRRDRVLTRDEIRAILDVVDAVGGYGDVIHWLFWTACRLDEACSMRWRDVDLGSGLWTIPVTKTGQPHVVPLPRQAMDFLRERGGDDALVFVNTAGHKLNSCWDRATKRIMVLSATSGWHRHDIRRTGATLMGELGVGPHVIEVALGHALRTSSDGSTVGRIAGVYNRSRYRAEHADALQRLADELDRIVTGERTIVRLRA